ncbi:putative ribosome quality control (RQC) complex YloA/Tae2 family protein [Planomicrobium soli]|uniref:Rqc2 homolog RqcH n=1 Tax=Planomicrobium soli TaxID=1176648 RepID=A0A2P8H7P0_9BACL|nr:NFACT RNA binding domain-containing protein [Planomicrobium soli]PSL42211.1 putative ribosome quality control (RQC) complex YloA/Tae2 family protein [Planomicrobium soli]
MAFDGLFTKAMTRELQSLVTGRISKVHQPNQLELLLHIRAQGHNHKLLISIHPSYSRIHLTAMANINPSEPPMFCMLLRKHIEGGVITDVVQHEMDRLIIIKIRSKNEIGDDIERELHVEMMGRHSNVILVDSTRMMILDSLKHLPPSVNSYRTVLPGQAYVFPPSQEKIDPFSSPDGLIEKDEKELVGSFAGFSPLNAREFHFRTLQADNKKETARNFLDDFLSANPIGHYVEHQGKSYFSATALTHIDSEEMAFPTLGELLDRMYYAKAERDRVKQQAGDLERWLQNEISKLKLKLKKLQKEQDQAEKRDELQLNGELIMANLHRITKGMKEIEVDNYYNDEKVTITLDPRKTPIDNSQRYYSRYQKAKTALVKTQEQIEKTTEDIEYFETLMQQVQQAGISDIEEIREELAEQGFMKAQKSKKKKKPTKPTVESYVSSTGTPISVGKNNKQNDFVTFKVAAKSDTWLHTKDIPGSHVIIHDNDPDETTLLEAAAIAAYFSKARDSSSVPVDYTEARQVKKPNGAKPGFVIYFEQKTVFVTPDEDLVIKLKK